MVMESYKPSTWFTTASIFIIVTLCYWNSYHCGFVFDDASAVVDNKDLRPHTSLKQLFLNDFWGTPMKKERSHKSYRPLCVLTFRLNYALSQLAPEGYHITNVFLHFLVCILLSRVYSIFVSSLCSFMACCLFAVHPIHVEAVTGVVGRAEMLSAIFFLLSFISYVKSIGRGSKTHWRYILLSVVLVTIAVLCKEQGITVVAICIVYEIVCVQKMTIKDCFSLVTYVFHRNWRPSNNLASSVIRGSALFFSTSLLLLARIKIMGAKLPVFTSFDNPASTAPTPDRQMTYNYLLAVNSWLLLFPSSLCCDWTMGTIPVIKSFIDVRNSATLIFYVTLVLVAKQIYSVSSARSRTTAVCLSFIILPFIPASNLFFPVGFVVAERILYAPSIGYCLLVAHGCETFLHSKRLRKWVIYSCFLSLVTIHAAKTIHRNFDWENEYTLFRSALRVNKHNAKLWNNVGHALEKEEKFETALRYFKKAAWVQPDDIGAHINVGRTLNTLGKYVESEASYQVALSLFPPVKPGQSYTTRIAPNHLNVFLNLANLISKNQSRLHEAIKLYRTAVRMRPDYVQAYINMGDLFIKLGRPSDAIDQYKTVLHYEPDNSDAYYNLGVISLQEGGKQEEALAYFNSALEHNPDHYQSLYNSAMLIQDMGRPELIPLAFSRLEKMKSFRQRDSKVLFNLAMLKMDEEKYSEAESLLVETIDIERNFSSALFNLALMLNNNLKRPLDAFVYLEQLVKHHPRHVKGLTLMGDININVKKDLKAAEQNYLDILSIDPTDIQANHNLCVVYVESGDLLRGEKCLANVQKLAPSAQYIAKHLDIIRNRIQKLRHKMSGERT